ncbi:MAG: hypothetical protein DRP29_07665 [Thermodesulfobacteriota bacterium]|nr:MAG: hypothetical protein DRP29_07665 [Thermodesulfobacteriota bacterium]
MAQSIFESLVAQPKKISEEEKRAKALENNPLIQHKPLDPLNGIKKHWIIIESMTSGVEKHYFWILRFLREQPNHGMGFDKIEKVKDIFGASVGSSFHSQMGTKLASMPQTAAQYLGTIGGMVKTLFPLVREIRIMDERLEYYEKSKAGDESAEIALKSIWIELVEQGMQNPNSVYGLATKVGFVTLPDLFFGTNVKSIDQINKVVKQMVKSGDVNKKVGDVLAKKLFQYYTWKEKTYNEMQHTRKFKIKYLRQHYDTIKLYMDWVRPYLKGISQLQMKTSFNDADIVGAFETAKVQIELLAYRKAGYKKYHPALLVKFDYVTLPELHYTPQGQRQPLHMGRTEITIEPYVVTEEQIEDYKTKQDEEDVQLLASLDAAMMSLKDDLVKYLEEAGEIIKQEKKAASESAPKENLFTPFKAVGSGFKQMFSFATPSAYTGKKKPTKKEALALAKEKEKAAKTAATDAWVLYDIFKKSNRFCVPI